MGVKGVILDNSIQEATKEGNASEATVAKQIILISSTIIVLIGVLVFQPNPNLSKFDSVTLLVAVAGLGVALLAGVAHFWAERHFWYKLRQQGLFIFRLLKDVQEPGLEQAIGNVEKEFAVGPNRTAFWIQLAGFSVGSMALIIVVVAKIISTQHK